MHAWADLSLSDLCIEAQDRLVDLACQGRPFHRETESAKSQVVAIRPGFSMKSFIFAQICLAGLQLPGSPSFKRP